MAKLNFLTRLVVHWIVLECVIAEDFPQLFNNRKSIFSLSSGAPCVGADRSSRGSCLSRQECARQGGKGVGFCGVFSTCCALTTCDVVTDAKSAVFNSPPLSPSITGLECSYTVEINNPAVCQIRVDLESFSLSQPNTTRFPRLSRNSRIFWGTPASSSSSGSASSAAGSGSKLPGYACELDVFQVNDLQAFSERIPALCGENSGQHLYVRVNASLNQRTIRLNFKVADRTQRPDLAPPSWRVRVTQLECFGAPQGTHKDSNYLELLAAGLPAAREAPRRESRVLSSAGRDQYLLAPDGCLQYYPDRSGAFESFNYNRGKGPYLGRLHYATCFRRTPDVCGIKLVASKFAVAYNNSANNFVDQDCQGYPYNSTESQDYLFIPEGESMDGVRGSKWCGSSAQGQIVASTPPGPLHVYFFSDNLVTNGTSEAGYRINYNVLNNC